MQRRIAQWTGGQLLGNQSRLLRMWQLARSETPLHRARWRPASRGVVCVHKRHWASLRTTHDSACQSLLTTADNSSCVISTNRQSDAQRTVLLACMTLAQRSIKSWSQTVLTSRGMTIHCTAEYGSQFTYVCIAVKTNKQTNKQTNKHVLR